MPSDFFTVTHLDGSTRTYDYAGRPAYLGFKANIQHIDIRPEPTQAAGCAAANDAWNHGGRQAWLDLSIQAHVKTPVVQDTVSPRRCTACGSMYYGEKVTCPRCVQENVKVYESLVGNRPRPKFDVPCTNGQVYCRICGVRHNHTFTCPTCGSTVDVRTE